MNDEPMINNDYTGDADELELRRFPVLRQLTLLALVLGLIFGGSYIPQVFGTGDERETVGFEEVVPLPPPSEGFVPELGEVAVRAKAAFVWDVRAQRVLFAKEPDAVLPLASITKLMTTLVAYELVAGDEQVSVSDAAIRQDGDSGLLAGERFALQTLSDYALISSSNDAAFALASAAGAILSDAVPAEAFVVGMNVRAEELGLTQTAFKNPTGLDVSASEPGAVGSARDVSVLMEYILSNYPELLEPTQRPAERVYNEAGAYHDAENTNALVGEIPNLIGSKTGYTDLAGGNLVVAFDAGLTRPIIVTVLGSTYTGRFTDVMTLVEATNEALAAE